MDIDIGNALAREAAPGVSRGALDRLDERVETAHDRIMAGRDAGEHGYAALNLPDRTDPRTIQTAVEPVRDASAVLTIGIGGSALGAATLTDALVGRTDTTALALDNVDPAWVSRTLDGLSLADTALHVVSRSGTTCETLANFMVVTDAFERAGVDWRDRTIVTTGPEGPLRELATRHDLPVLSVPEGVPGRYAALSSVGLVPAAICGHDIDTILAGGRAAAGGLTGSLFDCPAYAYGAVAYALDCRGGVVNAMVPYAESLETYAEWFAQLWAESLGKDGLGQTPVRALGVTDQHSQLQLYRAGPRDKLVTFVVPQETEARPIPTPEASTLSYLEGASLGDLLSAEFEATEASLVAADRPNVRIEIDRIDERSLGELLYSMEAACIMAGELYGVDTFDQPAVEWAKRATRDRLGGEHSTETATIGDKATLRVER